MELRIARKLARLTQKQLGRLAGIDDSAISLIENGLRDIGTMSYFSVVRLRRALAPDLITEDLFPVPDLEAPDATQAAEQQQRIA